MIILYKGSGSPHVYPVARQSTFAGWADVRQRAGLMLRARGYSDAAQLLDEFPFEMWEGTNSSEDEFPFLYLAVPPEQYVGYEPLGIDPQYKLEFNRIAEALVEADSYVRFIAIGIAFEVEPPTVATPTLEVSSEKVVQALLDAEHLIATRGPTNAVDRVHTAFHAYLVAACRLAGVPVNPDDGVTQLFKRLRTENALLQQPIVNRVLAAMASIVDTLNPVRNRSTLVHPNEILLERPEAILVINAVRTMLHYLDARTVGPSSKKESAPNPGVRADC